VDRHLVVRSRRWTKKRTPRQPDSDGSRQKLFANRRRKLLRSVPAVLMRRVRKGPGKVDVARKSPNSRTLVKNRRICNNDIWDRYVKEQPNLRM
jgi:hypothetical protein